MQESLITMRRKARSPFIYNVLTTYTYCNDRDGVMEFGRRVGRMVGGLPQPVRV